MSALIAINLLATFAVFSAVCWRLYCTAAPHATPACRAEWALWGAVHIGIALAMLSVLLDQYSAPRFPGYHMLLLNVCMALLFLMPWRCRRGDR